MGGVEAGRRRARVQHSSLGAAFANRISYGKILYGYSDSNAEKHIENALAVVRKWRDEHKR
jgi:thioredoxin-dependent peroxiredoxin